MVEIKVMKIGSDGFPTEHGTSDDITLNKVTGITQIGVISGVTITSNIAFNAVADTIAGIENQNLLDKSANETISGNFTIGTGYDLIITDAPSAANHAVNKNYVDSLVNGAEWQDSVLDRYDPTSGLPGTPSTGDRYISTATANGWTTNYIYEYNGSTWDETIPTEGFAAWVDDEDVAYVFNGTSWVKMTSVFNHNDLSNIQGGSSSERYHILQAEATYLSALVADIIQTNLVDKSAAETISGAWAFNGEVDVTNGEFTFPNAVSASPAEGDSYWDGTTDTLYVYNGTAWVDIIAQGPAIHVQNPYTAGTGGISQYDAVYISGNDTVLKASASASATAKLIGFATAAILAAAEGEIQEDGVLADVLTGAIAGTPYYLDTTAGGVSASIPTGSGNNVVRVGYAKNSTDLAIQIQHVGVRS